MERSSCVGSNCGNAATMQCPTCIKNKLAPSYFCSQNCFKENWPTHKAVHKKAKNEAEVAKIMAAHGLLQRTSDGLPPMFRNFSFTGTLRPSPISDMRTVPDHIPRPDYAADGQPYSEMKERGKTGIKCLNEDEIAKARKVSRLAREVLDIGARMMKPGVSTDEIDRAVHEACIERNAYPSPLNYYQFPKSCCTSVNEVICHGIPDGRELQEGDICNLDVTLYYDGYHGDLNETYFIGEVTEDKKKLVRTAKECLDKAIALVKPGTAYRELGNVIAKHAKDNNLSVVRSYCGHGCHELFHTTPNVPHYAKNRAVGVMKPGHCFTIEPMINMGHFGDVTWPDSWTSTTVDGLPSAQFEHTMLVTETGVEVLTARLPDSPFSV